ncbi:hypothetical protein, partial [Clavibacter michiganensis]|uniref:hypothetical protein n=1 Tax=Clavibacter michiganensis TaxID=28447 RepID=UPI00292DFA40
MSASPADGATFRAQNGLDSCRQRYGVLGALASRKNIPLVCDALSDLQTCEVGLLLAGAIDEDARSSVEAAVRSAEARGIKVISMDRLLTDKELDSAVCA